MSAEWMHIIESIAIIIIYSAILWVFWGFARGAGSLAPRVPTRTGDKKQIAKLAGLESGQRFVEIGCGTALIARYVAEQYPDALVIGIEIARPLVRYVRHQLRKDPLPNLQIIRADAMSYDYSDADVIYVYGMPKTVNKQLKQTLIPQMKSGARLISYVFDINDWPEGETQTYASDQTDAQIHVYTKS